MRPTGRTGYNERNRQVHKGLLWVTLFISFVSDLQLIFIIQFFSSICYSLINAFQLLTNEFNCPTEARHNKWTRSSERSNQWRAQWPEYVENEFGNESVSLRRCTVPMYERVMSCDSEYSRPSCSTPTTLSYLQCGLLSFYSCPVSGQFHRYRTFKFVYRTFK